MRASRTSSVLAAVALLALVAGCGGGSTATQSAGVTTTTSLSSTPSPSSSSTSSASASSSASATAMTSSGSATASKTTSSSTSAATTSQSASSSASAPKGKTATKPVKNPVLGGVTVASAAFPHGGRIPARYTCEGGNVSPPLRWGKLPAGTAQLFLIALSLNKGTGGAVRWTVAGIDPRSGGFGAGALPAGAVVGRNSEGNTSWAGACPAKGATQSIVVLVYALRNKLNLASGFAPSTAQSELRGQTLGTGVVYGTFQRP